MFVFQISFCFHTSSSLRRTVQSTKVSWSFQARFMLRVLRALPVTRRKMNPIVLRSVMKTFYTADGDWDTKDSLLKFVAEVSSHCFYSRVNIDTFSEGWWARWIFDSISWQGQLHSPLPRGKPVLSSSPTWLTSATLSTWLTGSSSSRLSSTWTVGYKARHPRLDPECRTTVELSSIVVLVSDLISDIWDFTNIWICPQFLSSDF